MKSVPDLRHVADPVPEFVRAELAEGETDPFRIADAGFTFAAKEQFVVAYDGERPLATAGWLARTVRVAGRDLEVAAVGGVIVRASCRGRGLARIVSSEVLSAATAAGHGHALLLCLPEIRPFWAHLGWTEIEDPVTYADTDGSTKPWPLVAMSRPLGGDPWPAGAVDLCGLPF